MVSQIKAFREVCRKEEIASSEKLKLSCKEKDREDKSSVL